MDAPEPVPRGDRARRSLATPRSGRRVALLAAVAVAIAGASALDRSHPIASLELFVLAQTTALAVVGIVVADRITTRMPVRVAARIAMVGLVAFIALDAWFATHSGMVSDGQAGLVVLVVPVMAGAVLAVAMLVGWLAVWATPRRASLPARALVAAAVIATPALLVAAGIWSRYPGTYPGRASEEARARRCIERYETTAQIDRAYPDADLVDTTVARECWFAAGEHGLTRDGKFAAAWFAPRWR